jgi:hypothetical protein
MSASTETLVKLRGQTNEGRSKANRTHDNIKQEAHKNKFQHNIRVNKITALNNIQFGGNYSFQLPAFAQLCGEAWIEVSLPALSTGTYRKYPLLHVVDLVQYRCGQKFFEFSPRRDIPILLSRIRNKEQKTALRALFGGTVASAGGTFVLPLLTPMSIWASDRLSKPIEHGARGAGFWDAGMLSDNMVIEITMAQKADACSGADAAFTTASDLGNVVLKWEEVVAAPQTLAAMKAQCPKHFICEEYTRLENQTVSDSAVTTYRVASLISRAGTTGFIFRARSVAADDQALDCMAGSENVKSLVVRVDGREIYDTDSRSDAQRSYQEVLAGNPQAVGEPKLAHFSFGASHRQYDQSYIPALLKNGAANECDLDIQAETGDERLDITACHLRSFTFSSGTIRTANVY